MTPASEEFSRCYREKYGEDLTNDDENIALIPGAVSHLWYYLFAKYIYDQEGIRIGIRWEWERFIEVLQDWEKVPPAPIYLISFKEDINYEYEEHGIKNLSYLEFRPRFKDIKELDNNEVKTLVELSRLLHRFGSEIIYPLTYEHIEVIGKLGIYPEDADISCFEALRINPEINNWLTCERDTWVKDLLVGEEKGQQMLLHIMEGWLKNPPSEYVLKSFKRVLNTKHCFYFMMPGEYNPGPVNVYEAFIQSITTVYGDFNERILELIMHFGGFKVEIRAVKHFIKVGMFFSKMISKEAEKRAEDDYRMEQLLKALPGDYSDED